MKSLLRLLVMLRCVVAFTAAAQVYWPSFRGPGATGLATNCVTVADWDVERGRNLRWKTPIPGLGHSSPVVWGDRIFLTTAVSASGSAPLKVGLYGDPESADDNGPQQWKVLCLDKHTGRIHWQQTATEGVPRVRRHQKATHANCSVATDGTNLVACFGSEGLYCYDLEGRLRWKKPLGVLRSTPMVYNDQVETNAWSLEWGFASSPIVHEGTVFLQCDILTNGFVAAFDLTTGRERWRTRRDDTATWSTPNICGSGEHRQLVVNGWNHMGGYDVQTGREIWRMAGGGDCPVPTPQEWNGLFLIASSHGPRSPIYAVRSDARGDVSIAGGVATNAAVAWSLKKGGPYMQTPLIYGDLFYSCRDDGILSCLDPATGRQHYKERLGSGGEGFTASPVASWEKLYFTGEQGTVVVVRPGPAFQILATNHLGAVCMATPAISEGVLYFRTQGHLLAIGDATR